MGENLPTPRREVGPFVGHALDLQAVGLAVLPAAGKAPLIKGYRSHRYAASKATINGWSHDYPDADIVYQPGLSRIDAKGVWRVIVIDADTAAAAQRIGDVFGSTPGQVITRRGRHFLFRIRSADILAVCDLMDGNTDLRRFGIEAEIKSGHDIVVGPYSNHADDPDFTYRWDGVGDSVIKDLSPLLLGLLEDFVEANTTPDQPPILTSDGAFRDGSRGLYLNDQLCRQVAGFTCREDVLDVAAEINEGLVAYGHEPLGDSEVTKRADAVWKDFLQGKLEPRHNRRARASIGMDEINRILEHDSPRGSDVIVLLAKLRGEHAGRMRRGETFAISDRNMSAAQTLPGWGRQRIRGARDVLIELRYIERVSPAYGNVTAAQYRLIAHESGPSLERRRQSE